jgi:hypothetical protein
MSERRIDHPRPFYEEITPKASARYERLEAGGSTGGIVLDITRKGLVINGYYLSPNGKVRYANTLKPVRITWEELEKAKVNVNMPKKRRAAKKITPDRVEDVIDETYLKSLPIVTINNDKYYIDAGRKERRSVKNPTRVYKF